MLSLCNLHTEKTASIELVVIDTQLSDYHLLVEGLPASAELLLVDSKESGFHGLANWLLNVIWDCDAPVTGLHILSHGSPGKLMLGGECLSLQRLVSINSSGVSESDQHLNDALSQISDFVAGCIPVYLYGCHVAQGEIGQQFVDRLSRVLGTEVAASSTLTASPGNGGDWELSYRTGEFFIPTLLSPDTMANYTGALANPQIGAAQEATVSGREIILNIVVENLGDENLTSLSILDDLDLTFGAGNYTITTAPQLVSSPGTITINGSFDGSADTELLDGSSSLGVGESAQLTLTVFIDTASDQGSGLGVYSSQVTASGTGTSGNPSDLSDSGTNPDPNGNNVATDAGEDDPTPIDITSIFENPQVGAALNSTISGTQVTLDYYLENLGDSTLSNFDLANDLDAVFGSGNYSISSAPAFVDDPGSLTLNGSFDGSTDTALISSGTLAAADTAQIRVVVDVTNVTDQGSGLGVFSNQVTVNATSPTSKATSDVSDNGTNPDGNGDGIPSLDDGRGNDLEGEPTPIVIGEEPQIGIAKTASVSGSVVTFDYYLENLGNVSLSDLEITDDLDAVFGAGNYFISSSAVFVDDPGTVTLNSSFNGGGDTALLDSSSTLGSGDTAQVQLEVTVVTVSDQGSGIGVYSSQANASGTAPGGAITTDQSDDGIDPDPNANGDPNEAGENDPTDFTVAEIASVGASLEVSSIVDLGGSYRITLRHTLENLGNVTLSNLTFDNDLNAVFGAGNYSHSVDPDVVAGTGTATANTAYNGNTNTTVISSGVLAPGEFIEVTHSLILVSVTDQGFGNGIYQNQITVLGTDPDANPVSDTSHEGSDPDPDGNGNPSENDPTVIDVTGTNEIGVALDASVVGNVVTVNVYLENLGDTNLSEVTIRSNLDDVFGAGNYVISSAPTFIDDPGTLVLDGTFTGEAGGDELLDFTGTLNAADTAQIQFEVTVSPVTDQGLGVGNYSYQVDTQARTPIGDYITDSSDSGTDPDPNGNGDATEAGENDATTLALSVDSIVGAALDISVSGRDVTFDYYLENTGIATASDVSFDDDLDALFGAGNYTIKSAPAFIDDPGTLSLNGSYDGSGSTGLLTGSGTLTAGDTAQIQMVVTADTLADNFDLGFGSYQSQFTVSSTTPSSIIVTDASDAGTDPDPNGNNDPSEAGENDSNSFTVGNGEIGIAHTATVNGSLVTLDFYIENLGDATVSNILMENPLNSVFGSGNYSVTSQPTLVDGPGTLTLSTQFFGFSVFDFVVAGGSLDPGDTSHIRTIVNVTNVTDQGSGVGVFSNQVTVDGTDIDGASLSDTSDWGFDPDPDGDGNPDEAGENDATSIIIGDEANLGVALNATPGTGLSSDQVTLDFYLENFGGSTLSSLSLADNLDAVFGTGNYTITSAPSFVDDPGTITLNASFDGSADTAIIDAGSTLAALDTAQIQMLITVDTLSDQGNGFAVYQDQVTVTGSAPLGTFTQDVSDSGTDPDPDGDDVPDESGENDVTEFTLSPTNEQIGIARNTSVVNNVVTFDYYVENLGGVALSDVIISEDLDALFGAGNYTITSAPAIVGAPRALPANISFDGSGDTNVADSGTMAAGDLIQFQLTVQVDTPSDQGSGTVGEYSNSITASATGSGVTNDTSDSGTDPDPDGDGDPTEAGENDPNTIVLQAVIGDFIFNDLDGDGTFNGSDVGIDGLTINLIDDTNGNGAIDGGESSVASTTTSGGGAYEFSGLAAGDYIVSVTDPTGFVVTAGSEPLAVTVFAGQNVGTADVGYQQQDAAIGDFIWNDLDGDGVQDGGESGISGVTVFLDTNANGTLDGGETSTVTDGSGAYDFTDLATGSYEVTVDETTVTSGFVLTGGTNALTVNLAAGEDYNDADFGYQQQDASIGDFVWNDLDGDGVQDGGESGIDGVTLDLYLDNNSDGAVDGGDTLVSTQTTAGGGAYDFTNLATGVYLVDVTDTSNILTGFVITGGTDPVQITLAAGEDNNAADFGYQQQDASTGDFVWNDLDGDGVQDAGEPGIDGVTIDLYLDNNSDGSVDGGDTLITTVTTAGGGAYDFGSLATGTYLVDVTDTGNVLTGFELTGVIEPIQINLAAGEDDNDTDIGYQQQDATIGDFIWNDLNGDGVQDGGETGISGVTVFLDANANGILDGGETSAVTDGSGAYDFSNLATGTYEVTVDETTVTSGFVLTGGTNALTVNLAAGEDYNDADFGYQQQDASIGDFIWNDLNGDGVQDGGEAGIDGVTLDLYLDNNLDGAVDGSDTLVDTQTSSGGGLYDFTDLATGTYLVEITDTGSVLTSFVLTGGTTPVQVNLAAGEDYNDADFGYKGVATIGDLVWFDRNGNGVQDGGDEAGIDGVTIDLYQDNNSDGVLDGGDTLSASDTTAGGGIYSFVDVAPGDYLVTVTDTGNVLDGLTATTTSPTIAASAVAGIADNSVDFGYSNAPTVDLDGNDSSGIGSGGYQTDFTEGAANVAIADTDTIVTSDIDIASIIATLQNRPNGNLEGLSSILGSGLININGEDVTIGTYDDATGILQMTVDDGAASVSTIASLIETLRYTNSSNDPGSTDRTVSVSVTDSNGIASSDYLSTINIVTDNDPPQFNENPSISGDVQVGGELTITDVDVEDPEGATITLSYQWFADGSAIDGATEDAYTLTNADIHKDIQVRVTAFDGDQSASINSNSVSIPNQLPVFSGTPIILGDPVVGETLILTGLTASDPDGDSIIFAYQWIAGRSPISGATSDSLLITEELEGEIISVEIAIDDGFGGFVSTNVSLDTEVTSIDNLAPEFLATPSISGEVSVGGELSVVDIAAEDPEGATITYIFQWLADGAAISGATMDSYTLTSAELHADIQVIVTATDGVRSTSATTASVSIPNELPELIGMLVIEGNPAVGETLTVTGLTASDPDGDAIELTYQWFANGSPITGETGEALLLTQALEGVLVSVQVSASDGFGGEASVSTSLDVAVTGEDDNINRIDGVVVDTSTETNDDGNEITTAVIDPISPDREDDPNSPNPDLFDIDLLTDDAEDLLLRAGLPTNVGLSASVGDVHTPAASGLGSLLESLGDLAELNTGQALRGATNFLQSLDNNPMWINELVLTSNGEAAGDAIQINGPDESSSEASANHIVTIIDASNLLPGTEIELNGIDFAIVLGPVSVSGGAGDNIVFAGNDNQTIVLGAGDDELHGGAGDDIVGSTSGNDQLFGDEGNDRLFGGEGDDLLHGGSGLDIVTFELARENYIVTQTGGAVTVISASDASNINRLVNVESIEFSGITESVVAPVEGLNILSAIYGQVLDRQADLGGFDYWAEQIGDGKSLGLILLDFLYSEEYTLSTGIQYSDLDEAGKLTELYRGLFDRDTDVPGFDYWTAELEGNGGDFASIANGFVYSLEMQSYYQEASEWNFFV